MSETFTLIVLAETFAVSRLDKSASVPTWACSGGWWSVTRTDDELSMVCPEAQVPAEVPSNRGWKCLQVAGPLDLTVSGVLASLLEPLAQARISVFSVSTFDTDYLLVKTENLAATARLLSLAGHQILGT
ncbi:MAG TPA: ACT domain-containing protein [Terriglobia bacterium]|nr:ACT domain-containing protein [Terriglobia bacterium]